MFLVINNCSSLKTIEIISGTKTVIKCEFYYSTNEPLDLSSANAYLRISEFNDTSIVVANITANILGNTITAEISSSDTKDLSGRYIYQPIIVDYSGKEYVYNQGIIEIIPEIEKNVDEISSWGLYNRAAETSIGNPINIYLNKNSILSVTMYGKTTQSGTGDPSPENIRPISAVGDDGNIVVTTNTSYNIPVSPLCDGDTLETNVLTGGGYKQREYHTKKKITFDGSELWDIVAWGPPDYPFGNKDHARFRMELKQPPVYNTEPICNCFKGYIFLNIAGEGVMIGGSPHISVIIRKDRLSTVDVPGFKAWLASHNITIVYELAIPTETLTEPTIIENISGNNDITGSSDMKISYIEDISDEYESGPEIVLNKYLPNVSRLNLFENFCIISGTSETLQFDIFKPNGEPQDLTGCVSIWKMSKIGQQDNVLKYVYGEVYQSNSIIVKIDSDITDGFSGKFLHQLSLIDLNGNQNTFQQGIITILPKIN